MIIGLTGKNAAGKGEVAKHLQEKGYVYFSLSDELRKEATNRGLVHSRENLISLGTELREKEGVGCLALKINKQIDSLKKEGKTHFVVDSIRNPGEIEELRKNKDFVLMGIHTDAKIRFERLLKRGRTGDAKTLEEFKDYEEKENKTSGSGQQLGKCLELADITISSNGTIEKANDDVDKCLSSINNN